MSNINFNNIHSEVRALILKDVIVEEGTLKCRLVCKDWKKVVDERVFKIIVMQLQEKIGSIPTVLGLRNIVIKFTDEANSKNKTTFTCDVQKVQQFCNDLATAIGPKAKKLITSAEEINALIQQDTNLHILWEAIQKNTVPSLRITAPSLKTCEEISDWFREADLSTIQKLWLRFRRLTSVPEEIKYLTNLHWLDLDGNVLKEIPKEIGNFVSLEHLYLNNNQLEHFPKEIGNCTNLVSLSLNDNKLKEVKGIGFLTHLQHLLLSRNQLEVLSNEIGNLKNLYDLWLDGNQLKKIPNEIGNCVSLGHLYLDNNQLKKVPKEIRNCNNLRRLEFKDNQITQILSDEVAKDLSIIKIMLSYSDEIGIMDRIVELFKQLSKNGKNRLATYFYQHNHVKFTAANKNHQECAKETLDGNPYYDQFLVMDNLVNPIIQLIVEIASSNDVEEVIPPNDAEIAIGHYLSSLNRSITWRNKEPVQLKEFALCGIRSLDDLTLLLGAHVGPSKELQQITCPSINWDLVEQAKSLKDLTLMQQAVFNTCSDFAISCSTMIAFINDLAAKTQFLDLGLASIEAMKAVAGEIESLNGAFQEDTNGPYKVREYFKDPSQWQKLQAHFTDILNKLKDLELDHQSETISAYFDQHMLVSFWKQPENANKSLLQLLEDRNASVAELFKLTHGI